jgi:hypothetical protein
MIVPALTAAQICDRAIGGSGRALDEDGKAIAVWDLTRETLFVRDGVLKVKVDVPGATIRAPWTLELLDRDGNTVFRQEQPGGGRITYGEWMSDLLIATDTLSNAARINRLVQPFREWKILRGGVSGEVCGYREPSEPAFPPGRRRYEPVRDANRRLVGMREYFVN